MIVEHTYISIDGKRFDDEQDCLEYERKFLFSNIKEEIKMYDTEGNLLPLNDEVDFEISSQEAVKIVIPTEELYDYLYEYIDKYYMIYCIDIDEITSEGIWYRVECSNDFHETMYLKEDEYLETIEKMKRVLI